MPRLLDLFCGRWGWSRAFAARGWECVGVDLVHAKMVVPRGCRFLQQDVLNLNADYCQQFDFIVGSSPCEEFSVFGMPCFFPDPKYPDLGIKLFNHARSICFTSKVPYVLENVRAAEKFVGAAAHHCGSFHLWGNGIPPLMPQGIVKGFKHGGKRQPDWPHDKRGAAKAATIPPELANCVAEYAERILEERAA